MSEPVTAVLLSYRRPWNMPVIIESLRQHDFIRQIIVWNNGEPLEPIDGVRIISSPAMNAGTYGRFLAARHALHEIIYSQDDDYRVLNVDALYRRFLTHQTHITAGLDFGHFRKEAGKAPYILPGWGSFHRREWFACIQPWLDKYGLDELLKSKFDRIYSCMHGLHDPMPAEVEPLLNHDGRRSDMDTSALYRQPRHRQLVNESVEKALALRKELAATQ